MGFDTERPAIFRRTNKTEENYLVLMHYLAGVLWARGASVEVGSSGDLYDDITRVVSLCEARGQYPLRLDADDWLTLQGIAQRIGTSREVVRLWSASACGPKGFPPPLNPNRDTSFYSWAEVSRWIRDHTRHDPGPDEEPVLVAMNLALQLRRLLPRLSQPEAVLKLIQPTAASISPASAAAT